MPTFETSEFSPPSLGDAGGAGASSSFVDVSDGGGTTWRVYSDGSVKAIQSSTYPSVVGVLKSAAESKQILANLRAVPGNASKIDSVTGGGLSLPAPQTFGSSAPPGTSAQAVVPAGAVAEESQKLWNRVWFWPAVILTSTTLVSGAIWWFYSRKTGRTVNDELTQLRAAMANPDDEEEDEEEDEFWG